MAAVVAVLTGIGARAAPPKFIVLFKCGIGRYHDPLFVPNTPRDCSLAVGDARGLLTSSARFTLVGEDGSSRVLRGRFAHGVWLVRVGFTRRDAGKSFVLRADVSAAGQRWTLTRPIHVGPVVHPVSVLAATTRDPTITRTGDVTRPYELFLDIETKAPSPIHFDWDLSCHLGAASWHRSAARQSTPFENSVGSVVLRLPLPAALQDSCTVSIGASRLGGSTGTIKIEVAGYARSI